MDANFNQHSGGPRGAPYFAPTNNTKNPNQRNNNNNNKKKNQQRNNENFNANANTAKNINGNNSNNNGQNRNNTNNFNNKNTNQLKINNSLPTGGLPEDFVTNYITNVSSPTKTSGFGNFNSIETGNHQSPQKFYGNNNKNSMQRSPSHQFNNFNTNNNHHNRGKNKKFGRSNSNSNIKGQHNYNGNNNNSCKVVSSPSDPSLNGYLNTSGEFTSILNDLKQSPKKLMAMHEETTSTRTTTEIVALSKDNLSKFKKSDSNEAINSTLVNTSPSSNAILDKSSSDTSKDYYSNAPISADQSEISENQYFSANETKQSSSEVSTASISTSSTNSSSSVSPVALSTASKTAELSTSTSSECEHAENQTLHEECVEKTPICNNNVVKEMKCDDYDNNEQQEQAVSVNNYVEIGIEDKNKIEEIKHQSDSSMDSNVSTKTVNSNYSDLEVSANVSDKSLPQTSMPVIETLGEEVKLMEQQTEEKIHNYLIQHNININACDDGEKTASTTTTAESSESSSSETISPLKETFNHQQHTTITTTELRHMEHIEECINHAEEAHNTSYSVKYTVDYTSADINSKSFAEELHINEEIKTIDEDIPSIQHEQEQVKEKIDTVEDKEEASVKIEKLNLTNLATPTLAGGTNESTLMKSPSNLSKKLKKKSSASDVDCFGCNVV